MLLTCTNGLVKSTVVIIIVKYITTTPNNILSMRHSNSVAKSNFPPLIISIVASCCDVRLGRILVPCVRLPRISANLGQLRVTNILLCMRLSGRLPTKEVVARTVAALQSRLPWRCTVYNSCLHACIINDYYFKLSAYVYA